MNDLVKKITELIDRIAKDPTKRPALETLIMMLESLRIECLQATDEDSNFFFALVSKRKGIQPRSLGFSSVKSYENEEVDEMFKYADIIIEEVRAKVYADKEIEDAKENKPVNPLDKPPLEDKFVKTDIEKRDDGGINIKFN